MRAYKKIFVVSGLFAFMFTGIAATHPPNDEHYTNLKVLRKKISSEELERIMYAFERQLGVTCVYCHTTKKNVFPAEMDFASDEKPEKKIAREMLKMTLKINKKYFGAESNQQAIEKPKMWCRTCHRGFPVPPGTK